MDFDVMSGFSLKSKVGSVLSTTLISYKQRGAIVFKVAHGV